MRVRLSSALTAALLLAPSLGALAQSREPYPGFDAYVSNAMRTWKVPGLSIAIVRNDSVVYSKGFGTVSVRSTTQVDERTLFEIGSSTKAFTSTLVAMMVTDGKMRWDDRISTYLPDFRMSDPVANEAVTIRDALSHRSGVSRGELIWLGSGISRDEVVRRVRFLKPQSPFRSRFSYQNIVYMTAGQAAAKTAGTTWETLAAQRIFQPLGMTSTIASSKSLATSNVAVPHGDARDSVIPQALFDGENIAPAGAILSNAVDMAQWLRFQLGDGTWNGKRLVSAAALRETHTPQILAQSSPATLVPDSEPPSHISTYAMGWIVEDYRGALSWQHGGNTMGMTAAVGMLPEKRLGVVVLSNVQSAQLPLILERYVFDRALGLPVRDLSAEAYTRVIAQRKRADSVEKAQASVRQQGNSQPPVPFASFAGTYSDSLYGDVVVAMRDGHLELTHGQLSAPLEYRNANNFRWAMPAGSPVGPQAITFEINTEGEVTGLYFGLPSDRTLLARKNPRRVG